MDDRIGRTLIVIQKSYKKKLILKDVACESRLGISRFCQLFKTETGMTFKKYIKEKKLSKARRLLSRSSLAIKEISYEVGYKSPQSFSNDFRKRFFVSPLRYRQEKARFHSKA